ncbi:MAG: hypothetical protein IJW49_07105 [Clostridia bacterium]|nr:hypothetical protein [Clostridia bacterium]
MNKYQNDGCQLLFRALLALENEEDCAAFLEDLMTQKEIADVAQRLLVAKMLSEQVVYSKIVEETGASTATISRINRAYNYGTGGYRMILDRVEKESKK